jgi:hypothetical protein
MNFFGDEMKVYLDEQELDIQESTKNCRRALKTVISELLEIDPSHPKLIFAAMK